MSQQRGSYLPPHKRSLQNESTDESFPAFDPKPSVDKQQWSNFNRDRGQNNNREQPISSQKSFSNYSNHDLGSNNYDVGESEMAKLSLNRYPRSDADSSGNGQYPPHSNSRFGSKSRFSDTSNFSSSLDRSTEFNRFGFNDRRGGGLSEKEMESQLFDKDDEMTEGINFGVYDKIPVELSGTNPPEGLVSFDESKLHEQLLYNINRCKYTKPTPVQKYAVPCIMTGKDLMACAQTGSGKTAAYLLPIIHRMMEISPNTRRQEQSLYSYRRKSCPRAVIMSPTRELAIQIEEQARKFLWKTGLKSVVVYGGANAGSQLRDMSQGCDIVVATPGRLLDFMESGKVSMESVQFCVLDEGDRMLDMGFMPQIQSIIREMPQKGSRQTLMFSATFPPEIQKLAQEFLDDYFFLAVGRVGSTNTFIRQKMIYVDDREKLKKLMELLPTCEGLTLIFVETRRDANDVENQLVREGFDAISIHGDRTQREREHALSVFRSGKCPILVATDVAARGLDIPNVLCVINYDLPNNIEAYVHRIGRTGRCGHDGNAIAFVNDKNRMVLQDLLRLLHETKQDVPQWFSEMVHQNRKDYFDKKPIRRNYRSEYGNKDYRRSESNRDSTFTSRRFNEGKTFDKDRTWDKERKEDSWNDNKEWKRGSWNQESDKIGSLDKPRGIEERAENRTDSYSKWNFTGKSDSW